VIFCGSYGWRSVSVLTHEGPYMALEFSSSDAVSPSSGSRASSGSVQQERHSQLQLLGSNTLSLLHSYYIRATGLLVTSLLTYWGTPNHGEQCR